MAFTPNIYNQPFPSFTAEPPVNGLVKVNSIESAKLYYLPKNSVSPPLFLDDERAFFVKSTDENGVYKLKKYRYEEEEIEPQSSPDSVTKDYLDSQLAKIHSQISKIMEAVNEHATTDGAN